MASSYQTSKPYKLKHTLQGHTRAISCVKFSGDGSLVGSSSLDKTIRIWRASDGHLKRELKGHTEGISEFAWSSDSHFICSASDDKTLRIWDVQSGKCIKTLRGHTHFVFCVDYNPQSTLVASGSFDKTLRVWDVNSGKCSWVISAHSKPLTAVNFVKDGSVIVSSSHDGTCKVWEVDTCQCLGIVVDNSNGGPAVSHARFAPSGKLILFATLDNNMSLLDIKTKKILKTYSGHTNSVYCIFFAVSMTKYIASGSEDHCVYVWNAQKTNLVQKLEGHTDTVISVDFHHNTIASGALDNDRTRINPPPSLPSSARPSTARAVLMISMAIFLAKIIPTWPEDGTDPAPSNLAIWKHKADVGGQQVLQKCEPDLVGSRLA
eukprot:Gb_08462 [translate_table: standard]